MAKGKRSHSESLHKGPSVRRQDSLRLSEHNPWQGSARAHRLLCRSVVLRSSSDSQLLLELAEEAESLRKAAFPFSAVRAVGGHCFFSRSLLVAVCLFRAGFQSPGAACTAHLRCGIYFLSSVNTWEGKRRNWNLFFKLVS